MAKTGRVAAAKTTRQRKLTRRQGKQVAKTQASRQTIPTSFSILGQVFRLVQKHWRILGGIMAVYLVLNIVFASGLSTVINNFSAVKDNLSGGHSFSDALGGFGALLGGSAGGSESASVIQSLLVVIASLVIIWALRQLLAGKKFSVKEAYYNSMFPLIPFLLVILVIIIQLLPITLGSGLVALIVSTLSSSGLATFVMVLLILPLFAWSLYMVSSSIFALYIVTLPDMQPRQALRSAKKLVSLRRLQIIRRLVFLPIFMLLAMAVIMLPFILYVQVLVVPVFYLLSILALLFAHSYLYSLYRGLLDG